MNYGCMDTDITVMSEDYSWGIQRQKYMPLPLDLKKKEADCIYGWLGKPIEGILMVLLLVFSRGFVEKSSQEIKINA